jgi:hypothetical protein
MALIKKVHKGVLIVPFGIIKLCNNMKVNDRERTTRDNEKVTCSECITIIKNTL